MPRRISASTVTSANISASLRIATYVADADREVYWRLSASGLAGSFAGYMPFVTTQFGGVGASHFSMPDTSASPGAGKTAIYFQTIPEVLLNTDIHSIYFVGSASDTSVSVTAEIFETMGACAISASNIASGTLAVGKFGASAIAASNLAGSAINDAVFTATVSATLGACSVDATSFAQSAADKTWLSATRTLTQPAATVAAIVAGSAITLHRGDSQAISITGLGNISTRSKLWFTAKNNKGDADASAIMQIEETAGLVYFYGAAAASPTLADITVTNETSGNITINLDKAYSALLARASGRFYDIQWKATTSACIYTASEGEFNVSEDVTRAVS